MATRLSIEGLDPNGVFAEWGFPERFRQRVGETRFKQEWKMSIAQYVAMMREFKGPRKQRGIICAAAIGYGGDRVILTNHSLSQTNLGPNLVTSGPAFETNGTLNEIGPEATTFTAVQAREWWSAEPETSIGSNYDVQRLSSGATGAYSTTLTADTWYQISEQRVWRVTVIAKNNPSVASGSSTFEIRATGTGSALDSAVITAQATN